MLISYTYSKRIFCLIYKQIEERALPEVFVIREWYHPRCTTPCRRQIVQRPLLRTGGEYYLLHKIHFEHAFVFGVVLAAVGTAEFIFYQLVSV